MSDVLGDWSRSVLKSLEELDEDQKVLSHELARGQQEIYKELHEHQETVRKELTKLNLEFQVFKTEMKIKSGIWGLLGGAVTAAIGFLVWYLKQ